MTVEEMEENLTAAQGSLAQRADEYEEETIDEDEQAYLDVQEGIKIIGRAKILLRFLGSGMLKTITKREHKFINDVAQEMQDYMENVYPVYMEDAEEESGE